MRSVTGFLLLLLSRVHEVKLWLPIQESIYQQVKIMPLLECFQINSTGDTNHFAQEQMQIKNQYLTLQLQFLRISTTLCVFIKQEFLPATQKSRNSVDALDYNYIAHGFNTFSAKHLLSEDCKRLVLGDSWKIVVFICLLVLLGRFHKEVRHRNVQNRLHLAFRSLVFQRS